MGGLTPEDVALLERARRGVDLDSDDRARVKRKLFAQLGIGVAAGTSTVSGSAGASAGAAGASGGAATGAWGTALVTKVAMVAGIAGGVVGMTLAMLHGPVPAPIPASPPVAAPPASSTVETPLPAPRQPLDVPDESIPTVSPSARPAVPPRPVRPAPVPSVGRQDLPPGPSTVGAEAALLRRADSALKSGDPSRARALLDEHASTFPRGILSEEREAERVIVLCALGQVAQARAAAATFLRARPRSPLAARVRGSCGGP